MSIPFSEFYERLLSSTSINNQAELAKALCLNRSAITQAKKRNAVPQKWVLALARHFAISPDWLEFGTGRPYSDNRKSKPALRTARVRPSAPGRQTPYAEERKAGHEELVYVPKALARLCAGGGSFEVEATPVSAYPFPRWWLAKMGSPSDMVFMDVVGDSMEPGICDGDTVLVDRGHTRIESHSVLAVGVEEAIYLKRVERCGDGIILHSDNAAYPPMELFGDELENFRVIGKVVWLCRDCR